MVQDKRLKRDRKSIKLQPMLPDHSGRQTSQARVNCWICDLENMKDYYTVTPSWRWRKIAKFFFCHLAVRSTIVFYSTSNYRVSEKSISIFPQLGVMLVIVGLKVSSYHWITRMLSLIKHRLDLIKAARHRHYVNQLIRNRCQLTVIIYILDYIQFSLK